MVKHFEIQNRCGERPGGFFRWRRSMGPEPYCVNLALALPIAFVAGVVSGLIGVSGGILKVPMLVLLFGVPMNIAVGSSAFMVGLTAMGGFLGHLAAGHFNWKMALMLAPAWLFHPRPFLRFLAYMLVFGAWDLSYYAFLKVFLGWPAGLLTYDILFLLPTVWVAPVLCPVLISLAMIAFTTAYLWLARTRPLLAPGRVQWAVPLLGGALVLVAFMRDAGHYLGGGLPPRFAWAWFLAGLALAVAGGAHFLYDFARSPRRRIT